MIQATLSKEERAARASGKWRLGGASERNEVTDLGGHIVIVPAPMAGRLIQEELARLCPRGLLIPRFATPANFLNDFEEGVPAREADALLAWIEVLASVDRTAYGALFPLGDSAPMSHDEARRMARSLMQLRDELGGSATGHSFAEVAKLRDNPEPDRWSDLARLEEAYGKALAARGLADHNDRRRHAARSGKAPAGTTHIWLAGVADPQPLVISALARLAGEGIHVRALVGADNEPGAFDDWGRPVAASWSHRELDWPEFNQTVHVVPNPLGGLGLVRSLLKGRQPVPGTVALCACDREADSPKLAAVVRSLGAEAVDPLGRLHSTSGLHHALRTWAACLREEEPAFAELRAAFHVPEIVAGLANGRTAEAYEIINTSLDEADQQMANGHLGELLLRADEAPDTELRGKEVDARRALANLKGPLTELARRRAEHLALSPEAALKATLRGLVGNRPLRPGKEEDAFLIDVLGDLDETANALAAANAGSGARLGHAEFIEVALDLAGAGRFRWSEGTSAVNLPGWLEAPWDPVPHLVVFGLNDHLVPRSRHADPFLPARLRELVGLPTNGDVFAAAAFSLEQMRRQRLDRGRLDIIVPQADANGEPLRPSRLLFLGPTDKLPERVELLFGESESPAGEPYWEIPERHRLNPRAPAERVAQLGATLSASSLATYLGDPAEYWMQKALGMGEVAFGQVELGHADFGTLMHSALERWARRHIGARGPDDALAVSQDMVRCLGEHVRARFGATPPPAVRLQVDIAARRLRAFAERQVALWNEGWVIEDVEFDLPGDFKVGKATITGRVDRLDRHPASGRWRVYDYKTFSDAKTPESKHFRRAAAGEVDFLDAEGKRRWIQLQMPLYKWVMGERWPGIGGEDKVDVGYICLPAQIRSSGGTESHVMPWDDLAEQMEAAKRAIRRVEALIRAGKPESYQPTGRSEYPLLPGLASRPMDGWMDITGFGEVRR